jgi:arginyl-tRNA synthetase
MKAEIIKLIAKQLEPEVTENEIEDLLEIPPDEKLGDYALPCFAFAKKLRMSPQSIAEDIVQSISNAALIAKVQAVSGYLNIFVDREWLSQKILQLTLDPDFGKGHLSETTVVEYCSPNTNKPLHLGHLRNMAIGKASLAC